MTAAAQAAPDGSALAPTLTGTGAAAEDLRAAALAELLGDIYAAQRSQKDLIALQEDLDKRLTGSISALRTEIKRTQDLLAMRDTLFGELAVRAAEQARREFLRAAADAQVLREAQSAPQPAPMPVWQTVLATASVLLCLGSFGFLALAASRHFSL